MGRFLTMRGVSAPNPPIVDGLTVLYFNCYMLYQASLFFFFNCSFAYLNSMIVLSKLVLLEGIN